MALAIDRLSPAELRALDTVAQIHALDDLCGVLKSLGDLKCDALDLLAEARMRAIMESTPENRARVVDCKRNFDKVGVAISTRKEQVKIFQTLLKATPA